MIVKTLKKLQQIVNKILAFILLSFVYFIGVGITSIVAKMFRKSFLNTKLDKNVASYWEPLNLGRRPKEEYYRQF